MMISRVGVLALAVGLGLSAGPVLAAGGVPTACGEAGGASQHVAQRAGRVTAKAADDEPKSPYQVATQGAGQGGSKNQKDDGSFQVAGCQP
jgi:hypothetical protein